MQPAAGPVLKPENYGNDWIITQVLRRFGGKRVFDGVGDEGWGLNCYVYLFWYTSAMPPVLTVRFYATASGTEPVRDWLKSLVIDARKAIGEDIKTVQFGWPLGMPLVRKMEPGLWEVHSDIPDGIARVLFTTVGPTMVLLHGFVKKADKTPKADLRIAQLRKTEVHHD